MGEAAETLTMEGAVFAASPAFQLRVVREQKWLDLSNEERALVDLLEATFVRGWINALASAPPARAADLAVELWSTTARAWRLYAQTLTALLERHGLLTQPVPQSVLELLERYLPSANEHVPHLPSNARAYVRAFTTLVEAQMRSDPDEAMSSIRAALAGAWPDEPEFHGYMALLHALLVAGTEERIPDEVATALAVGFWARVRALATDPSIRAATDDALREAIREVREAAQPAEPAPPHAPTSLLSRIREIGASVPAGAWAAVPTDASRHLDRYLYRAGR